jgi:hypothetical protein
MALLAVTARKEERSEKNMNTPTKSERTGISHQNTCTDAHTHTHTHTHTPEYTNLELAHDQGSQLLFQFILG